MGRESSPKRHAASPEWKLILACARTRLDDQQRCRIRELLNGPLEWSALIELAGRQRVEALLSRQLAGEFADNVPPEVVGRLKQTARTLGQWNLRLAGQMFRVLGLLKREALDVVPYKGPVLGALAYGSFALRNSEDLDFVLGQRDVPRAFALLRDAGFLSELDPSIPRHERFLRRGDLGQYLFRAEDGIIAVELHTEKTLRYFPVPLDWDGLQARLRAVSISGHWVQTFSAEDLLVLLSVHGAKHFWSRLSWICDIAELAQIPTGIDWLFSERLARRMGCRRMWLLGLSLAHEMLDAPLPETVLRWIADDSGVATLCKQVQTLPIGEKEVASGLSQRLRFRMLSHESKADGLRQCVRVATRVTEEDWGVLGLPEWAEPLYGALRPLRLLYKHGLGLRRSVMPDRAPHVPPLEIVERMLRRAGVSQKDLVYDLGCGDGRVVVAAARRFGARAVGFDVDPIRLAEARANARQEHVEHLVEFRQKDARAADFTLATVVVLHRRLSGVLDLAGKLRIELRAGARVVSRDNVIPGWVADEIDVTPEGLTKIYLWRMPEAASEATTRVVPHALHQRG